MENSDSRIPLKEIHLHDAFSNLFPKRPHVLDALKKHIEQNGFDEAFPLILAYGPWTERDLLLDGHCRKDVCEELGLEEVPVVRRFFKSEDEALAYMIHVQKDRRNLTDAEIVNCVGTLDQTKGAGRPKKLASCEANFDPGKSAERTAAILGVSRAKVEKVRNILKHGDSEMKQSIQSGKSINKAYQEIQARRKMEETQMEATEVIDKLQEGNIDHEMILSLPLEANDPEDEAREPECWAPGIINGFDSNGIDYVILGQGTSPDTLLENQQVFLAPWIAPRQGESIDPVEVAANQETCTPAPPKQSIVVNLSNYDAEGWYALEQEWAKFIPGFVPEPPEGIDVVTATGESPGEGKPLPESGITQVPTDTESGTPAQEIAVETAPTLDPRIAQVLDLKATEDGTNVIVKFLKRHGLCRTNSFGSIRIDRERLLRYLMGRDANTLEAFTKLLTEFQAGPQIDLPPDEDLQIDLHNSFFHFPYGARWFWQCCPTKDDNGFLLGGGRFGANVLTFMAQYELKCLDDIVQKVATMNEELRPRRSAPETC